MIDSFFDKIYVLNLTRRPERRYNTESRLTKVGIENYEFFKAIDGNILESVWKKVNSSKFINKNYLACCLSHLSIYQDALDRGFSKILILEDDCLVNININKIWEDNVQYLNNADLWYFGYIPLRDDEQVWDYNVIKHWYTSNVFKANNLWGLFSYGIRSNLMSEIILHYKNNIDCEIDRYLVCNIQDSDRAIGLAPQLWACDITQSDNSGIIDESIFDKSTGFSNKKDFI